MQHSNKNFQPLLRSWYCWPRSLLQTIFDQHPKTHHDPHNRHVPPYATKNIVQYETKMGSNIIAITNNTNQPAPDNPHPPSNHFPPSITTITTRLPKRPYQPTHYPITQPTTATPKTLTTKQGALAQTHFLPYPRHDTQNAALKNVPFLPLHFELRHPLQPELCPKHD